MLSSISEINMYANYTEVQQLPYGDQDSGVLKKGLNTEFWTDFFL